MISLPKYKLEFNLHIYDASSKAIKASLEEFGENVDISECNDENGRNLKISLNTEDPTLIFDICAQFGRIKSIKIEDLNRQNNLQA